MRKMAIPNYPGLDKDALRNAPPGHKFGLYFRCWNEKWEIDKEARKEALEGVLEISPEVREMMERLRIRQLALLETDRERTLIRDVVGEETFVTGMGIEHPVENGFTFLGPYGIPYLPGSSIKGVVRRAAEDLALFCPASSWTLLDVWWLFGFDANSGFVKKGGTKNEGDEQARGKWKSAYTEYLCSVDRAEAAEFIDTALSGKDARRWDSKPKEFLESLPFDRSLQRSVHFKGSVSFWDVIPLVEVGSLRLDVMNPHHKKYYESSIGADGDRDAWPGDWEDPGPVFYLAVPPGTRYRFILRFEPVRAIPKRLRESWKDLLGQALDEAFSCWGFGAKTSQGYGTMAADENPPDDLERLRVEREEAVKEAKKRRAEERERRRIEALTPLERLVEELGKTQNDTRVHEIFLSELDQFGDEEKALLARALKDAYGRLGKWSGKISSKQEKKVEKIKKILGEA